MWGLLGPVRRRHRLSYPEGHLWGRVRHLWRVRGTVRHKAVRPLWIFKDSERSSTRCLLLQMRMSEDPAARITLPRVLSVGSRTGQLPSWFVQGSYSESLCFWHNQQLCSFYSRKCPSLESKLYVHSTHGPTAMTVLVDDIRIGLMP